MDWKAIAAGIFALIAIGLIVSNGEAASKVGGTLFTGINTTIGELERNLPKGETVSNVG